MESVTTSDPRVIDIAEGRSTPQDDLKALRGLRTRIEQIVTELDRLRKENAVLAARVADLEESGQMSLPMSTMPAGEDMRERLDAFIAAIDQALRESEAPAARP